VKTSRKLTRSLARWLLPLIAFGIILAGVLFVSGVFPYKVYIIHTASMTPTIPPRSAVIVHEGPVKVGEVVTFRTQSGVVTHRLVKRLSDGTYQTKGDANETVDPGTIRASQIIGSVVAAPRELGYWLAYFKSALGLGSLALGIFCLLLVRSVMIEFGAARAARRLSWPQKRVGIVGIALVVAGLTVVLSAGTAQASFQVRVSGTMRGTLDPCFAIADTTTTTARELAAAPGRRSATTAEATASTETTSTELTEPPLTEPSTPGTDSPTTEPTTATTARPTTTTTEPDRAG
jgi:signal peptidase